MAAPIVYAGGMLYSLITGSSIQLGLLKIYSVRCSTLLGQVLSAEPSSVCFVLACLGGAECMQRPALACCQFAGQYVELSHGRLYAGRDSCARCEGDPDWALEARESG